MMLRGEGATPGHTDTHTRARTKAALGDEGEPVPPGCPGFAPSFMCTFTTAKSWQRGTRQPDLMLGLSPPLLPPQDQDHYVAVLPCGRCCGWGGRQRDGILQAQQDPIPWAERGWAACGQHHAGLRALPLPGPEHPWPGSASSACKPSQQAGNISESCKRGEKQPPQTLLACTGRGAHP